MWQNGGQGCSAQRGLGEHPGSVPFPHAPFPVTTGRQPRAGPSGAPGAPAPLGHRGGITWRLGRVGRFIRVCVSALSGPEAAGRCHHGLGELVGGPGGSHIQASPFLEWPAGSFPLTPPAQDNVSLHTAGPTGQSSVPHHSFPPPPQAAGAASSLASQPPLPYPT